MWGVLYYSMTYDISGISFEQHNQAQKYKALE